MIKRIVILLCFSIALSISAFAQSQDSLKTSEDEEMAIDIGFVQTTILSKRFYGINYNIKISPLPRFITGGYLTVCWKKISDTFTYHINKPIIEYGEIGWINQYDFVQTKRLRMNVNVINGFASARLGDNAIQVKTGKYTDSKKIATDNFYLLEPGVGISFKLTTIKNGPNVWLMEESNYRFVFGRCKYSTTNEFSNYLFEIGISFSGT